MRLLFGLNCLLCLFLFTRAESYLDCVESPLLLTSRAIYKDEHFSASSLYNAGYEAHQARLGHAKVWHPKTTDNNKDYLQIDLGSVYQICAVATKGNKATNEFTTQYKLLFSMDNVKWTVYEDETGIEKIFDGNKAAHILKKNKLGKPVEAKFIRLHPTSYSKFKALQVELYGRLTTACKFPFGMEIGGIEDHSMTASSKSGLASKARLYRKNSAWCTDQTSLNEFLQIDLGYVRTVTGMAVQGNATGWVTSYSLRYGTNGTTWNTYKANDDSAKFNFEGNTDGSGVRVNWLSRSVRARYIQINPKTWKKMICLRIELYGCRETRCDKNALGLGDLTLPNNQITSSSNRDYTTVASNGRLGYTAGHAWCASSSDTNTYLQIDLGLAHVVCAIATQGNSKADEWVQSYHMTFSLDGKTWQEYNVKGSQEREEFCGNFDQNSVVKHNLNQAVLSRYVRILPKIRYGSPCMRVELYGTKQSVCRKIPAGISWGGSIPGYRITSSSTYSLSYRNDYGRLYSPSGWASKSNDDKHDYLQVDLGQPMVMCAVATQGGELEKEWVTKYKIQISEDGRVWYLTQSSDKGNLFQGNTDKQSVVKHNLHQPVVAKFIRFYPVKYLVHKVLRVEAYGVSQDWRAPLGMESGLSRIPARRITGDPAETSRSYTAVRLYSGSVWCAKLKPGSPGIDPKYFYVQIDLGNPKAITGVATQGSKKDNTWMTRYNVFFALNTYTWYNTTSPFTANSNGKDIQINWFKRPIEARYIRLKPQSYFGNQNKQPCFSMELYGTNKNDTVPAPVVVAITKTGTLTLQRDVELTCKVYGDRNLVLQWEIMGKLVHSKPNSRKYANGFVESKLVVKYVSAGRIKARGSCTFDKHMLTGKDIYICTLSYSCKAFYQHVISDGVAEKKIDIKVQITDKCQMMVRCHSNSTCVGSDDLPEGYHCKCDRVGHFASSGPQGHDRRFALPEKNQYCRVNLALKKSAQQISINLDKPSDPENALDITKISGDFNNHGCSLTTLMDDPWWMLDMGKKYNIREVLLKRADCCPATVELHVGDSKKNGGISNALCGERTMLTEGKYDASYCDPPLLGRYVSVRSLGKNIALSLCGVEVYSDFTDVNECTSRADICTDVDRMLCLNTIGSYRCVCEVGLLIDNKTRKCVDQDECQLGKHKCDKNAECRNTVPGFECVCNKGYHGNGYTCRDVNECREKLDDCGDDATVRCINTVGSYKCTCSSGFQYDAADRHCIDIDECKPVKKTCTKCANEHGSYKCSACVLGYWRQGWTCEEFDECKHGKYTCPRNTLCNNTAGSYSCICKAGYTMKGSTCIDVNECKTIKCPANQVCYNTEGSFKCVCKKGYKLIENEKETICVPARRHSGQATLVISAVLSHVIAAIATVVLTVTAF